MLADTALMVACAFEASIVIEMIAWEFLMNVLLWGCWGSARTSVLQSYLRLEPNENIQSVIIVVAG